MEVGAPTSHQTMEGNKKNETEYKDSFYRIIQEIFINLVFVKFIDLSSLRQPQLLFLFPQLTLVAVHVVYIFTFYNKAWTLSMPWGRVLCICMVASMAMVICAHSPCLIEPLPRGSP